MPKILAIDDINDNLISLKAIIQDAFSGSAVYNALDGSQGIELAIVNNPDVILLDIIMPGMDGFEVCRRLKLDERVRDIPVVFLTALKGDKESRIKALEVGAEGFLSKPIDETELIAQIKAMVKIKAANEQKRDENERLEKLVDERTQELVKSEAQLKGIFENLQDAYFQADKSGIFTVISPSSVKMYGYQSISELIGHPAEKLYFDLEDRSSMLTLLCPTGRIEDYVCQGRKKDGSPFWVSMNVQCIYGKEGQILGTEGVVRDITERKKAEELLRDSNDLNASLLQSIPFAIDIVDENGKILFQNENLERLFKGKVTGKKCWEIYRDDKHQCVDCPLLPGVEIGKTDLYVAHGVLGNRIFEISHTGMMFKGKKAMLEIFMDITERKQTEELIRKNNLTLELAMNSANMAWWEMDLTTGLVTYEKRKTEMLGYSPENFRHYKDFMDLVHPDDYDRTMNGMKSHLIGTSSKYEVEYRIKTKSGEYIWLYDIGTVILKDSSGLPLTMVGIVLNITDRKRGELELYNSKIKVEKSEQQLIISNKELRERNKFIQTILDNLPIGVALNKINEGIAIYMNKKFEEIYGWSTQEMNSIDTFFDHVLPDPEYRNKLMLKVQEDILSGNLERMHWDNIFVTRKDGTQRVVNAVNIPLIEQNTMVSTVSDITDLHKTQNDLLAAKERAEESDRLKSSFLANMSHEIRTPLNSIIGFSELLLDPDFNTEQHAEFAKTINASGNGLLSIISDIMDISKIEAGQVVLKRGILSVHKLIKDIQKQYTFKAIENGTELRLDPSNPEEEIFIESDENKLRQILINFVSNAIKFTEHGIIEIGVRSLNEAIQFHVKDSGIGIPNEHHDKIFERFRQLEPSNSRKYGGNGLGLAISKSLVELLGGEIRVESEQGKGSTFYFTIPK